MIRQILIGTFFTIATSICIAQQYGSFKDQRDGRVYKTVQIGSQVWMAENLNADRFRNGDSVNTETETIQIDLYKKPDCIYYGNDTANGKIYGKLYNWYAVDDSRGLAPIGWRIPSVADWKKLEAFLGDDAGRKLKSKTGWVVKDKTDPSNFYRDKGTNTTGFSGLPGGSLEEGFGFHGVGDYCDWWTSSESTNNNHAIIYALGISNSWLIDLEKWKGNYYYVRCIKD